MLYEKNMPNSYKVAGKVHRYNIFAQFAQK